MKIRFGSPVAVCLLYAGFSFAVSGNVIAQDPAGGTTPPPKVMVIQNEHVKVGHGGSAHMKTESAFVRAFKAANWPQHYLGMDALSGASRAVFFIGYGSLDAWQKDTDAAMKDPTLSAALDAATYADGQELESLEQSTYIFRDDLSLRAPVKIQDMRYMEVIIFKVRPGHEKDWDTLVKMYMNGYQKVPEVHWATYQKIYGTESGSRFIAITPLKSLAEADQEFGADKAFATAMGAEQLQKLETLSASVLESSETHLYAINPKESYEPDSWATVNPEFWGQKTNQ
jgi:hypothetical protein